MQDIEAAIGLFICELGFLREDTEYTYLDVIVERFAKHAEHRLALIAEMQNIRRGG